MGIVICTYNLLKLPLISFSHSSPIQRERERERERESTKSDTTLQDGEGRWLSITSSKHSSGIHFISCRWTDKYKHMYKHSGMKIPTSGTHLGGRDGGGRDVGGPCGGGGKAINQVSSIKFDTCWRLFTTQHVVCLE